jgi:hypothetical protein
MLSALRSTPDDLDTLKRFQQLLFGEIIRTEQKIRKLKAELGSVLQGGGKKAAKRSSVLRTRIDKVRQCAYVWRCFGDAIAFSYMDKHALKQCFYDVDRPKVKQDAGFISDKAGVGNEIAWLEFVLHHNVPALLVDLTNTIRHGDICVMDGPDPYLIEVKTSNKLNQRGKRQKRQLAKLQSFFETDRAQGLRGAPEVRRQAFATPELAYTEEFGACIAEAREKGSAVRSPERGLFYIALTEDAAKFEEVLQRHALRRPWVFRLNEFKSERAWAPFTPFTLTIADKDQLWAFVRGDVYVLVVLDADVLVQSAVDKGYEAQLDHQREDYPLQIKVPGADEPIGVSQQVLQRIGMECVSPQWAVLSSIEMIERAVRTIEAERTSVS